MNEKSAGVTDAHTEYMSMHEHSIRIGFVFLYGVLTMGKARAKIGA